MGRNVLFVGTKALSTKKAVSSALTVAQVVVADASRIAHDDEDTIR